MKKIHKYYMSLGILMMSTMSARECISHSILIPKNITTNSNSILIPRNITTNSTYELALTNFHWFHKRDISDCYNFGFYATPFYGQTTKPEKIARYFLPHHKACQVFQENNQNPCNIESLWFGLESDVNSTFNGTFSMCPQRRFYGSYFNFLFSKAWCPEQHIWCSVSFALLTASHHLNMCEQINETAGPLSNFEEGTINQFTSIICALNNPEWNFGKFSPCRLKRTGVDDLQLKVGYTWFYCPEYNNHVSPYLVATIPTGKRQRSEFIFEPLVGSKHGSLGFGINGDYTYVDCPEYVITLLYDVKYLYYFAANQCRSFDLCKNGPWSRYLLLVPSSQVLATQPGINSLTFNAKVRPRSTINIWLAEHWQLCNYTIELGYNFWWREKEKICLKKGLLNDLGIFDIAQACTVPLSASCANISQGPLPPNQAASDTTFVSLTNDDINLNSGSQPASLSSTFYGAFGLNREWCCRPVLLGIGAQYEVAHNRSTLDQWAVWVKFGIIF